MADEAEIVPATKPQVGDIVLYRGTERVLMGTSWSVDGDFVSFDAINWVPLSDIQIPD